MPYTSFIDNTYFVGEINIPQASTETPLTQAVTQYEKEILIQLLGYKLYSLLIADCSGITGLPVAQKYIDLVNGVEFTHSNGDTLKWIGLKNTALQSLIAYYVFYKYVERDVTRLYPVGVGMSPKGNGFVRVSPVNKLINAWERMRELYGRTEIKNRHYNDAFFPSVGYNNDASAYNFLLANSADYPDWVFTPQYSINAFGI